MCPGWELNPQPFCSRACTQSTELHQPGLDILLNPYFLTIIIIPRGCCVFTCIISYIYSRFHWHKSNKIGYSCVDWKVDSPAHVALLPFVSWRSFLCSPETSPNNIKIEETQAMQCDRDPWRQSSQERKLKLLAGGKIWTPLWVSDIILFYYVFHFPVEESKIWEGMFAVFNRGARNAGVKRPLQFPLSLPTPPPCGCEFSEPGLLMHQGGGRGLSSINTDVMTSMSLPQP